MWGSLEDAPCPPWGKQWPPWVQPPHPGVLAWPRRHGVAFWPRTALCWLVRWGRPGKLGVRTHFYLGFRHHQSQKAPLSKDWKSLADSYGAFWVRWFLGTFLKVPCQGMCPSSFHQEGWEQGNATLMGRYLFISFFFRILGQDLCVGLPVQAVPRLYPTDLVLLKKQNLGCFFACLAWGGAFSATPLQVSHKEYGWVRSKLLPHAQRCFPMFKAALWIQASKSTGSAW